MNIKNIRAIMRKASEKMERTAADLKMGECGIVSALRGEPALLRRLIDLGITEGAPIVVRKAAPFGGPLEIEVRGSRLGIRREQARGILIRDFGKRGDKTFASK